MITIISHFAIDTKKLKTTPKLLIISKMILQKVENLRKFGFFCEIIFEIIKSFGVVLSFLVSIAKCEMIVTSHPTLILKQKRITPVNAQ